jgi:CRP/FNR family transcriptional regulator
MRAAVSSLQSQPLVAALPAAQVAQLAVLPVHDFAAGTMLFDVNASCTGFPILLSGAVRVFRHLANGRRIDLYRVTPDGPCILSLGCLLGGGHYPACGVTSEPTRIVVMPSALFNDCLNTVPAFRSKMFQALGQRLVSVMTLVEDVASLRLDTRLAAALLAHSKANREQPGVIAITHQQLADELGTVREMISRLLDGFAQQGWLALARGRIEILDADGLGTLSGLC